MRNSNQAQSEAQSEPQWHQVPALNLKDILSHVGWESFDLLKLDCEGSEKLFSKTIYATGLFGNGRHKASLYYINYILCFYMIYSIYMPTSTSLLFAKSMSLAPAPYC